MDTRITFTRTRRLASTLILAFTLALISAWAQGNKNPHEADAKKHDAMMKDAKKAGTDGAMKMEKDGMKKAKDAGKILRGDAYPLDTCIVTGQDLDEEGAPVVKTYDGREVRFCCEDCVSKFEGDKTGYLKKIDDAIVAHQKPGYPVETCVVSGEKLGGEMGAAYDYVHKNRLVRLCCKNCVASLEKDPGKYLAKLDNAVVEKQGKTYPLDVCVVSGEKLGGMGAPLDYVHNGQLVRFCCKGCVKPFEKDPANYMEKIHSATKGGAEDAKMKIDDTKDKTTKPAAKKATGHEGHNHN
jgi:YHS domain-containing protein